MLIIFSCAFRPSIHLLWTDVYLGLPPIFGLGCLFFWYWTAWAACKFRCFLYVYISLHWFLAPLATKAPLLSSWASGTSFSSWQLPGYQCLARLYNLRKFYWPHSVHWALWEQAVQHLKHSSKEKAFTKIYRGHCPYCNIIYKPFRFISLPALRQSTSHDKQLRTQARRKHKPANATLMDSPFEDGYFGESHFDLWVILWTFGITPWKNSRWICLLSPHWSQRYITSLMSSKLQDHKIARALLTISPKWRQ